jgi:type IV secretory pathway protease TraF
MKRTWSRIIVIVVALAAAGLAAGGLAACGCSTTSSSPNASASPTAGSSVGPSAVQQSAIAVAGGKDSTVLAAVSPDGAAMQLDPGDGHPIRKLAWSPDGTRVAMLKRVGSGQDDTSAVFVYDLATRQTT